MNQNRLKSQSKSSVGFGIRALIIGLLLVPINIYWVLYLSYTSGAYCPVQYALLLNVIFILLALILVNIPLKLFLPKRAFNRGELLVIYAMLCQSTVIAGHDMIQVLVPLLSNGFWYAVPENEWASLFHAYLPRWLVVEDKEVLKPFYIGESSFYFWTYIKTWLTPVIVWSGFIVTLLFTMFCINVILRKQWMEKEKLTYPIAQLPLEITKRGGRKAFGSKLMWIGFFIAGTIVSLHNMKQIFPLVPSIPVYKIILFSEKPLNAMNNPGLRFSLYPWAIRLGFFIPLDLVFSAWFFHLFWHMERIGGSIFGWKKFGFPYESAQISGAWFAILIFSLWTGRRHFITIFKNAFSIGKKVDAPKEALHYRTAVFGAFFGFLLILFFCFKAGMSLWFAILYFGLYIALSVTIARIRAQLGPPAHDMYNAGPDNILISFLGTKRIGRANLSIMSLFFWINFMSYRSHPMPHQLEALKLSHQTGMNSRRLFFFVLIAIVLGSLIGFWGYLDMSYRLGHQNTGAWYAEAGIRRLASYIKNPQTSNSIEIIFSGIGCVFAIGLLLMRTRFLWWPLHPVGYVVSSWWTFTNLWFPLFISWLIKLLILKYGGAKFYRNGVPFFLGLIIGDVTLTAIFSFVRMATGIPIRLFKTQICTVRME